MNSFMRMKSVISICYLSGNLELEGFLVGFFFVMEIMHKQDNPILLFLVVTVELLWNEDQRTGKQFKKWREKAGFFPQEFLRIASRSHGLNSLMFPGLT